MKRGYADTPEGQIHYYKHGRGEPLLLLHETPRSARNFGPMMRLLKRGELVTLKGAGERH